MEQRDSGHGDRGHGDRGQVSVRTATVADADGIARVHVAAWQAAYRHVMPGDFLDALDVDRRAAGWRDLLAGSGPVRCLVATGTTDDGPAPVLGFVVAGPAREAAGDDGEVMAINVDPAAWGLGAGARLLRAAEQHLVESGHRTARLWVVADNPRARAFYERNGWAADGVARTSEVGGRSAGGSVPVDEVRYAKELTG